MEESAPLRNAPPRLEAVPSALPFVSRVPGRRGACRPRAQAPATKSLSSSTVPRGTQAATWTRSNRPCTVRCGAVYPAEGTPHAQQVDAGPVQSNRPGPARLYPTIDPSRSGLGTTIRRCCVGLGYAPVLPGVRTTVGSRRARRGPSAKRHRRPRPGLRLRRQPGRQGRQ